MKTCSKPCLSLGVEIVLSSVELFVHIVLFCKVFRTLDLQYKPHPLSVRKGSIAGTHHLMNYSEYRRTVRQTDKHMLLRRLIIAVPVEIPQLVQLYY